MMIRRELRHAIRQLRATPGFAVTVIITLSLGIGATTALFTILNAVVLRPLPYRDPDRLVVVWTDDIRRQLHQTPVAPLLYRNWQERSQSFASFAYSSWTPVTLTGDDDPERLDAAWASSSVCAVLGVRPVEGRTFTVDEERRKEPVAVLSQGFAERRFGAARNALGRMLNLDGRSVTVIGVLPRSFQFPAPDIQLWLPLGNNARVRVMVIGRLRPSVTPEQAREELNSIGTGLADAYPNLTKDPDFPGFRVNIVSLADHVTGHDTRVALWVLMGAVGLVFAIACANVANLLVARASARQRDLAVRTALGARRYQILGHLLHESLMLTMLAAALGLLLATWLVRLLIAIAPRVPRLDQVTLDGPVLAFVVGVALLCSVGFAMVPAWHVMRRSLDEALREGGRIGGPGAGRRQLQRTLIVAQVALTLALVAGAGLLLRSLIQVERVPLGFNPEGVLVFRVVVPDVLTDAERRVFYREATERLRTLPGVSHVGVLSSIFTASTPDATLQIEGRSDDARNITPIADDSVSPDLFMALQTPLQRGRFFSETDTEGSPLVAIVNDTFARQFWSGETALGKRFRFLDDRFGDRWVTVVGVVADLRRSGLERAPLPQVFIPFAQLPSRGADIVVRSSVDPAALTRSIRSAIGAINPAVPVYRMSTLADRVDALLATRRFHVFTLSLFAGAGLLLAAVGLFGLMRYMVAQRTREIGVRAAMGATRADVIMLVLREGLTLTGAGVIIGVLLAYALTRSLGALLYGVRPNDPLTFALAPAILFVVAIAASIEPTWRAMRIDPASALRAN